MVTNNFWDNFWNEQTGPLHRYNDENWYRLYAHELNLIFESLEYQGGKVVESGCGNGALFPFLNVNKSNYLGIDISESMLKVFSKNQPDVKLLCMDVSEYFSENCDIELIFSNGCCQYLDDNKIKKYLSKSIKMLKENGILLIGNLPWKDQQVNYHSGELTKNLRTFTQKKRLKSLFLKRGKPDSIGYWYNPRDFIKHLEDNISVFVYGSLFHPYRFSIAFKKNKISND